MAEVRAQMRTVGVDSVGRATLRAKESDVSTEVMAHQDCPAGQLIGERNDKPGIRMRSKGNRFMSLFRAREL
jgi:hypothetical protein